MVVPAWVGMHRAGKEKHNVELEVRCDCPLCACAVLSAWMAPSPVEIPSCSDRRSDLGQFRCSFPHLPTCTLPATPLFACFFLGSHDTRIQIRCPSRTYNAGPSCYNRKSQQIADENASPRPLQLVHVTLRLATAGSHPHQLAEGSYSPAKSTPLHIKTR